MIKAVIWDLGGVLTYYTTGHFKQFWNNAKGSKKLREEFGTGKISQKEFVERGARLLKISKKNFLANYKKLYFGEALNKPVFGIYKKMKLTKYILSDTNPISQRFRNQKFKKIYILAKKNFLSTQIKTRKSSAKTFNFMLKKIKLKKSEILFIDDLEEYIKISKSIKIPSILYQNPKQLELELKKFGVLK